MSTTKNILYISYDGMTDPLGQSQVIPYVSGLSKLGYKITILSCEKKKAFKKLRFQIKEQLNNANIEWQYYFFSRWPPLLSKFWDIFRLKNKAVRLHKINNYKIVHCRSYMSSLAGLHLKKKFGVRFIFDMRGFWADERVDGNLWNLSNPVYSKLYKYFKGFEKECILKSDAIICLTRKGIKEMKTWEYITEKESQKIHHITTCCDIPSFNLAFQQRMKRMFDVKKIRFVYIGSIGPWHSFDKLTLFIKATYQTIPDSFFKLIINTGREEIQKFIADNQLAIERFDIKFVPHKQIANELIDTDIAFFFIPQQYSKIASSPTKMGEMLSAGLPIITGQDIGDVDELISDNNVGAILESFDTYAIQTALRKTMTMCKDEQELLMNRCLQTAQSYFSLEAGIKKYEEIYRDLTYERA